MVKTDGMRVARLSVVQFRLMQVLGDFFCP